MKSIFCSILMDKHPIFLDIFTSKMPAIYQKSVYALTTPYRQTSSYTTISFTAGEHFHDAIYKRIRYCF